MGRRIAGLLLVAVAGATLIGTGAGAAQVSFPGSRAWLDAARSGSAVRVYAGGRALDVMVRETSLLAPGATVTGLDGNGVAPGATTLSGEVAGVKGSWVRLTVTDEWVLGNVAVPGLGAFAVGRDRKGRDVVLSAATIREGLIRSGVSTVIEPGEAQAAATDCDSLDWTPIVASPLTLIQQDPLRTFDVAFAVDQTFVNSHPADWAALALSFVNSVDGLFRSAFDIRIAVVHLVVIPDAAVPSTTTDGLLVELQDYYLATYPNLVRDNVHLFTGKDPTNAAGQVNCVGSAGRTDVSYSVAQGDPGGPYNFGLGLNLLPDGALKISVHELAHTLSAHHHYANCVETMPTFDPIRTLDLCTVMINDWGLIQPMFGSLERLTVRGWADDYDI
ncbi:MAG: M12 family metallo-peptidase [Actinomycetota bacterium]